MQIDYLEAEFIKAILLQNIQGLKVYMQSEDDPIDTLSAIASFMGKEIPDDEASNIFSQFKAQMKQAQIIVDKINSEFGLNG